MLVILVAVLVLAGGGGSAYWMYAGKGEGGESSEEHTESTVPKAMVNFDPFVVNLADPGGQRFLRVTFGVVVEGEDLAKEFAEDEVVRLKVRSSIIELLSRQYASQLVTAEGKTGLKKAILEHTAQNAEHLKATDVLFSEFIVQ